MKTGKTFKRESIKQHVEVLNGLYIPKTIKKTKEFELNKALSKELEKEICEYLSRGNC